MTKQDCISVSCEELQFDIPNDFTVLDEYHFAASPFAKSYLCIAEHLVIDSNGPMPNRWHRFWQRLLLGWHWWEEVDE